MALLKIKDADGKVQEVFALRGEQGPKGEPGDLTRDQGNTLYTNVLKGAASGASLRLDDVSPLEHNVAVKVSSKNLCHVASITTQTDYMGRIYFLPANYPFVRSGATYTLSADVTVYEDDTADARSFDISVLYTDGTSEFGRVGIEPAEELRDGITRRYCVTYTIHPEKEPLIMVLAPLGCADGSSQARNAKAENIQLEAGATATEYTPYVSDLTRVTVSVQGASGAEVATYTPAGDGTCEVKSISPDMTLLTDTADVVIDCEYNRDINKAFEQLTEKVLSVLAGEVSE